MKVITLNTHIVHRPELVTVHSPPQYSPTPTFLSFDMSKTREKILTVKKGRTIYFDRLCGGRLPRILKLGVRVTQTSVAAVLAYQSTHAIYYIKYNLISVLLMYCMMQWIKQLSLHICLNIFLLLQIIKIDNKTN